MEKEGSVSLWIGNINTDDSLQQYVELIYTDEGEWLPALFLTDFNIDMDDFSEDFIERIFYEKDVKTLTELLRGCSYENIVIPRFRKALSENLPSNINSAILLYNFEYDGNIKEVKNNIGSFKFVTSVKYI